MSLTHLSHPKYRADIDGLRAFAVLLVVIYHAFPEYLKSGFIGVDIFFVISGFLISTIIFENLDKNTFRFSEFYARRIKRIFPTLLLVLITCLIFGWFTLLANEYKQLGKHIASGAGFISNFILRNESGYFDNTAETKPLIHLWSLGIEEQFYIVWPLLMVLAHKRKFNLLAITALITLTSFTLNILEIRNNVTSTFYSPHTRFWELSSGTLLAWVKLYKNDLCESTKYKLGNWSITKMPVERLKICGLTLQNLLSSTGLVLIVYGLWVINKESKFPGIWAIFPVIGALLIISGGTKAWLNREILSHRLLVWLGLISYPLYLWHWPLLSFARIIGGHPPSLNLRIVGILIAIILAWLSYYLVERPFRFGKSSKTKLIWLIFLMVSVGGFSYFIKRESGLPLRSIVKNNPYHNNYLQSGEEGGTGDVLEESCQLDDPSNKTLKCVKDKRGPIKYVLLGDSKARAMFPGIFRTSDNRGRWLFISPKGKTATVPIISREEIYKPYQRVSTAALDFIAKNNDIEKVVFVIATRAIFQIKNDSSLRDLAANKNSDIAFDGLKTAINILKASGKKIVIVVDNPTLPHPEDCISRQTEIAIVNKVVVRENPDCMLSVTNHRLLTKKYWDLLNKLKDTYPEDLSIFETLEYYCDLNGGVCTHSKDGRALYSYTDHISDYASGLVGKALNDFLATN